MIGGGHGRAPLRCGELRGPVVPRLSDQAAFQPDDAACRGAVRGRGLHVHAVGRADGGTRRHRGHRRGSFAPPRPRPGRDHAPDRPARGARPSRAQTQQRRPPRRSPQHHPGRQGDRQDAPAAHRRFLEHDTQGFLARGFRAAPLADDTPADRPRSTARLRAHEGEMRKPLAVLLIGTSLAGCVSTPSTTPSEMALKPDTLGLSTDPAPQVADRWWTAFGDPQLDALVDKALTGSPTLAAALARVRAAQSQLAESRAATYPQVTGDGQVVRERLSKDYIIPPPFGGSTQWVGTLQANLSWSLDLFGKQQAQIDRAQATAHAAALDATAARLLLAGNVTQAYIALDRAYLLIDVAQEAVRRQEGVLTLTSGRVKAGLDATASEQQARARAASARQDLIRAQAVRELAVHQSAPLIGRGADAYDVAQPQLSQAALELPATLPADLLARRADIAAAQARIEAATQGREVARKAYYPDINLIALAGTAALGLGPLFSAGALQYGAGAAIHLPIFDAGKLDAELARSTADLDQSVADYNETVLAAVKQTADAVTEIQSLQNQAGEQRAALAAAQSAFALAQQRYRSGLSPQLNVLDAENLLITQRRNAAALTADTASARVSLLMAIGGGFTPEQPSTASTSGYPHE